MLNFVIGFILGICAFAMFIAAMDRNETSEEPQEPKTYKQRADTSSIRKGSGYIIEPKSEAVVDMEEMFARNDREGKDTELKELI